MSESNQDLPNNHGARTPFSPYEWFAMMYGVYKAMPESERKALLAWEKEHIDGSGDVGTSDWPGWEKYIGPFPKQDPSSKKQNRMGFIYLVQVATGECKIGRTKNIRRRVQDFNTATPHEVELLHRFPADDMIAAEKELHKRFSGKRLTGEWFDLSESDIHSILNIESYELGSFVVGQSHDPPP